MSSGNSKKIELKLGRTGITIVVVGMAVFLFSVFLLGVFVGKNIDTYPEKIASIPQKALSLVWRKASAGNVHTVADNKKVETLPNAADRPTLTFYDDLTNKKGEVKEQRLAERKMVETPPPRIESPQPNADGEIITDGTGSEMPKKYDLITKKTDDKKKSGAKKIQTTVVVSKESYIIQAASLKEKNKADQVSKKITDLGYKTYIVKVEIKGKGQWYRVIVSGFDDLAQAKAAVDKITKKIKTTCIVRKTDDEKK